MKADPKRVLTGAHYLDGDHAAAEGALAAGCTFVAGYPITPSTEVVERMAERFPGVGGVFIQMEDELGSMAAVVGAAWGGLKIDDCYLRSGILPDDGEYRFGLYDGGSLCGGECAKRWSFDRASHFAGSGRYDAGKMGLARRL